MWGKKCTQGHSVEGRWGRKKMSCNFSHFVGGVYKNGSENEIFFAIIVPTLFFSLAPAGCCLTIIHNGFFNEARENVKFTFLLYVARERERFGDGGMSRMANIPSHRMLNIISGFISPWRTSWRRCEAFGHRWFGSIFGSLSLSLSANFISFILALKPMFRWCEIPCHYSRQLLGLVEKRRVCRGHTAAAANGIRKHENVEFTWQGSWPKLVSVSCIVDLTILAERNFNLSQKFCLWCCWCWTSRETRIWKTVENENQWKVSSNKGNKVNF